MRYADTIEFNKKKKLQIYKSYAVARAHTLKIIFFEVY